MAHFWRNFGIKSLEENLRYVSNSGRALVCEVAEEQQLWQPGAEPGSGQNPFWICCLCTYIVLWEANVALREQAVLLRVV